jgi:sterol desaturase/sphingolipid hydroxylase (fatty acid hydroxylase superfamily)
MDLVKLIPIAVNALFLAFIVLERVAPARPLPTVRWWRLKGIGFFALSGFLATTVPALYVGFLRAHRLFDLRSLGTAGGAVVGFVAYELAMYGWHRLRHGTPLWRAHQLHHSAERVDIFGWVYAHPLEMVANSLLAAVVTTTLLGVTVQASAAVSILVVGCAMFQHANIRTPRWLGYVLQRPESHSVHHARGVHAFNYCDLPLWDMAFGTFRNPERFEAEAGFYAGASARVGAMLVGLDVTVPRQPNALSMHRLSGESISSP